MRKLLLVFVVCAFLLAGLFTSAASAWTLGALSQMNSTEEEYGKRSPMATVDGAKGLVRDMVIARSESWKGNASFKFYDSMAMRQMGLNRGEVDAILTPDFLGEYMLKNNPDYSLRGFILLKRPIDLSLGFLKEKAELCKRFDDALKTLTENGMTSHLARYYISGPEAENPKTVSFEKFEGAETVNVLVTGDMPPVDYFDADGTPAGYNTALLAELGRQLRVNINLVASDSGARAAALKSGRVDVVFWFEIMPEGEEQFDKPEEVVVTRPYYGWNKVYLIGVKGK